MRWIGRRQSENVEDRRGGGGKMLVGGGLGATVLALIIYFLGGDPSQFLNQGSTTTRQETAAPDPQEDKAKEFISVVLADTEDIWTKLFAEMGRTYEKPKLVLFRDYVQSACGNASAASGPFYCPGDNQVYIDLSFYDELHHRFNAPGDFAMAYVVAHEIGHHVQNLLGISDKVQSIRQQVSEREANQLSVQLELQADFFAGVWAHYEEKMNNAIEIGDIDEALNAANAIGDDRLQKESQGYVVPDAFTHGTSQQRMYWFKKGYETGDLDQSNTFTLQDL